MPKLDLPPELAAKVRQNERLARHTTFRIGGPADLFLRADSREELIAVVNAASAAGIPVFILGNGSNILVSDTGVRGLVVENHADAFGTRLEGERLILAAESGASLPGLANRFARQGWTGLEWAIGVPSTIGAGIVGNAGAHGGSISDTLVRAELMAHGGSIEWWPNSEFEFSYRNSRLKKCQGHWIVVQAEFQLSRDDPPACVSRMNKYAEHRRRTQPTDPSVGSMFKNPEGDFAGRLIEAAGLKGTRVGQVQVSPVHANFFVNHGGAAASDVIRLVDYVKERVRAQFGVTLELEIELVGK